MVELLMWMVIDVLRIRRWKGGAMVGQNELLSLVPPCITKIKMGCVATVIIATELQ